MMQDPMHCGQNSQYAVLLGNRARLLQPNDLSSQGYLGTKLPGQIQGGFHSRQPRLWLPSKSFPQPTPA